MQICINCLNNSSIESKTKTRVKPNAKREVQSGFEKVIELSIKEHLLELYLAKPVAKLVVEPEQKFWQCGAIVKIK